MKKTLMFLFGSLALVALVDPALAQEAAEEAMKMPWIVVFLWPFISTTLTSIIKALADQFEQKVPPQLWPVCNMVIAAVIAGIAASDTPNVLVENVVTAVVAALGFNKTLDVAKGKASTVTPAEKAAAKEAGIVQ